MFTTLFHQLLTAIDLLGATAGLPVDALRWTVLGVVVLGVTVLARVQRTR